jgi:hypothetical protein
MSAAGSPRRRGHGMPPEDWDVLFHAVAFQLRHCVQQPPALPLRAQVEDCVHSLELLHDALAQERGDMRRIEAQLRQTCAALAATRAELARAQQQPLQLREPPHQPSYAFEDGRAAA